MLTTEVSQYTECFEWVVYSGNGLEILGHSVTVGGERFCMVTVNSNHGLKKVPVVQEAP